MDAPGQLSIAVTVKVKGALVAIGHDDAAATIMLAGQVITGACVSCIVIAKLQLSVLLDASFTEHATVVVPIGKNELDAGVQIGVPTPGQLRCGRVDFKHAFSPDKRTVWVCRIRREV